MWEEADIGEKSSKLPLHKGYSHAKLSWSNLACLRDESEWKHQIWQLVERNLGNVRFLTTNQSVSMWFTGHGHEDEAADCF